MSDQESLVEYNINHQNYQSLIITPPNHRKYAKGLIFMALSAFAFSVNGLFVKLGTSHYHVLQLIFARSSFQLKFGIIASLWLGVEVLGKRELRGWLLLRGLLGSSANALFYYSLSLLPMGDATVIFFTGPMFTSIFASLFLGEEFTKLDFLTSTFCLLGVTLCTKPSFLLTTQAIEVLRNDNNWNRDMGSLAAFAGAILSALAYVTVRKLGRQVHILVHITYFGLASSIFSFIMAFAQNKFTPVELDTGILILLVLGVTACIGQCFTNLGLQLAPAGPGTLMRNLDILFAFIYSVLIFNEIPDFYSILGAVLVFGCAVLTWLKKWLIRY